MPYCVDTSGWLDGWQRYYPREMRTEVANPLLKCLALLPKLLSGELRVPNPKKLLDDRDV